MRVLHVQKVAGIGGSERHLLTLLPELARQGVGVAMCVLATGRAERFVEPLRAAGIEVAVVPAGPDVNPSLVPTLMRLIRRSGATLVHTHLIHADLHGQVAARAAGVPAVRSVHSVHRFYARQPYRTAACISGRLARRTIAISSYVAGFVCHTRLAPAGRVRVVHYGVHPSAFRHARDHRDEARAQLGLGPHRPGDARSPHGPHGPPRRHGPHELSSPPAGPQRRYGPGEPFGSPGPLRPDDVVLGIASRLIPGKGHRVLLQAMEAAVRQIPGLRLVVAGDGPLAGELQAFARDRLPPGVARFLGHVDDMPPFFAACDCLVFPTLPELGEGFGLAALEAMATGCPVIATSVGSLPEVVVEGETGIVVPPGDVGALASAIVDVAADPGLRLRLGEGGRARAGSVFTAESMAQRTIDVYTEAL